MSDYYNETVEEQKIWNKTYMNLHPTRKLITGCANEDVAKWKGETTRTTIEPVQQQELLYNNNNNNKDDDMKNDDENKNNDGVCAVISDSTCAGLDWIRTQWQRIHSTLDPDMELEEWYNWEIVGVATEADIQKEINKEITIADIQKGTEKRRNKKVDLRNTRNNWKVGAWKQQESRSAEAQIH